MDVSGIRVEVRDKSLQRLWQLTTADLAGLEFHPTFNGVGVWKLRLPARLVDPATGKEAPHPAAEVLRVEGSGLVITGDHFVFSGPMDTANLDAKTDDPGGTWTFQGLSDEHVLLDHLAFPDPSNPDPSTQAVAYDERAGAAESVMRGLVSDNIGPTAPAERRINHLTLADDLSRGGTRKLSSRFGTLLEQLQKVATVAGLGFQVIDVGGALEFRVYEPRDRTAEVRMDIWNDQLAETQSGFHPPTVTRAIVAGQGEGEARTIIQIDDATSIAAEQLWGRRREVFIDQRHTDDLAELEQAGYEQLAEGGDTLYSLAVVPQDSGTMRIGVDWWLGDLVTVTVNGVPIERAVTEASVVVSARGARAAAVVGDPTGFDPQSVMAAATTRNSQRLSQLERMAEGVDPAVTRRVAAGYLPVESVVFTISGIFEKDSYPWLRALRVRLVGGGGGGGGSMSGSSHSLGQGGGGGGYAETFITDIDSLPSAVTVTVGAGGVGGNTSGSTGGSGGTSSFGSMAEATGGDGGWCKPNNVYAPYVRPGAGGVGIIGDILIAGDAGTSGTGYQTLGCAGSGGGSVLGGGAAATATGSGTASLPGIPGGAFGGGGSGAYTTGGGSGNVGGAGGDGVVILELFA